VRPARLVTPSAFAAIYAAYVASLGGLTFPLSGDGIHFWQTTLDYFSHSALPSASALGSYNELNTPLPFVVWGALEYWFHQGIWVPRALNLVLSVAVVSLIAWPAGVWSPRRTLAAAGLLLCPYYLFVSVRIYTDMPAVFCAVLGLWAYLEKRSSLSAMFFILAIASRQFMVAFPVAILANELARGDGTRSWPALMASVLAAASLVGWGLFFRGIAPPAAIDAHEIATANLTTLIPRNGLYLLSCAGLYFALPASVFFWRDRSGRPGRAMLATGAAIVVLFVIFPPFANQNPFTPQMGLVDRLMHAAGLPAVVRVSVLCVFAVAAIWSVWGDRLALWLTAANALVMLKAPETWDKYALPLLAGLWLLTSRHPDRTPCDNTGDAPRRV
jgi:hypothetical protein